MAFNLKKLLENGVRTFGNAASSASDKLNPFDKDFQRNNAPVAKRVIRNVNQGVSRVGRAANDFSDNFNPMDNDFQDKVKVNVGNYFKPSADKVRVRDVVRELPQAAGNTRNSIQKGVNDLVVKPFTDAAAGASIIPEFGWRASKGIGREIAGDRGGFVDEIASTDNPYYAERKLGKIDAGSGNIIDVLKGENNRRIIGKAAELPTYFYGPAKELIKKPVENVGKRIAGRVATVIPEAVLQTGIDTFIKGDTKELPQDLATNVATMGILNNVVGGLGDLSKAGKLKAGLSIEDVNKNPKLKALYDYSEQTGKPVKEIIDTAKSRMDEMIKKEVEFLKGDGGKGVTQGGLSRDAVTGDVVGRFGRVSNNPQWYRDFYAAKGRRPNLSELKEIAIRRLTEGDGEIPANDEFMKVRNLLGLAEDTQAKLDIPAKETSKIPVGVSSSTNSPQLQTGSPVLPASRQVLKESSKVSQSSPNIIPETATKGESFSPDKAINDIKYLLTGGKQGEPLMLPAGRPTATTPAQAKSIFRKTGETPRLEFTTKNRNGVITPTDQLPTSKEAKKIFRRNGVVSEFQDTVKGKNGEPIRLTENADQLNPEVVRKQVSDSLQAKSDNFERLVYGDNISDVAGGTKGATKYQQFTRPLKEKFNEKIESGLSSENNVARRVSRGIRAIFGGAGDTAERTSMQGRMRGGVDEARQLANDFQSMMNDIIPDAASKEKVWSVLDPELSGKKFVEADLNPQELKALQAAREASDLINDTNFSMGKISHEQWLAGKDGKYITRAYEDYDLPVELSNAFEAGRGKLELGGYKKRGEVTDWKQENAIKDPAYLMSKRIQSTFQNKAITDYSNWIGKQAGMVSDVPRAGYTQLSDSPMWGDLAGKNIRHDVLEGIKGFYSDSKVLQGLYDGLKAYDQWTPRQVLKKTKTVYNPATRLGNQTSNRVFALFNGLDPISFEKNMSFAKGELKSNGKLARILRKEGILGTDMTKYEIVKSLVDDGVDPSKLAKLDDYITKGYGAADDKAKIAALKSWMDRGKTLDEAIVKVRNGFQDYSRVGLMYDIGARLPIVGKSFVRFQSELSRIIKNSATENPLSLATVVGSIALMGRMGSLVSGETDEDRKTREGRFGMPVVPFTNIPLAIQTPFGEVNIARMFGMYETAGADTKDKNIVQRVSKYLPVDVPTSKEDVLKMLGNDVLTGGVVNQFTDTDFRGKSISDPDATKFKPSTLTSGEKIVNRVANFYHNYQLPLVNDIENVGRAAMGIKDQYGREKTVPQALSKLAGFKVEKFGPEQAKEQRFKDMESADYKKGDTEKLLNAVTKDLASGKIDQNTAQKRIQQIQSKAGMTGTAGGKTSKGIFNNPSGGFSYIDKNGSLQTKDTIKEAQKEVNKIEFEKTDKNYQIIDDVVYRRDSEGKVTATPKIKYDYELDKAKMERYKDKDDFGSWTKIAESQLNRIEEQTKDPSLDPVERLKLENDADDLLTEMEKYASYGGFKKGKSGSKKSSSVDIGKLNSVKTGTYKDLQGLLAGTTGTKATAQRQLGRKVQLRKVRGA